MRSTLPFPIQHPRTCILALLLAASTLVQAAPGASSDDARQTMERAKASVARLTADGGRADFRASLEVRQFLDKMASQHGFTRDELDALFAKVNHVETTIQLMKPAPPGQPKNWQAYRARFVEPVRINAGVKFWAENADALARAQKQYGVPADIIVGIIGVETVYGRVTGNFRVLDALTTLAFDYPATPNRDARMAFFQGELESALLLTRAEKIDPLSLLGSYAGAVGLPQFMPSSIRNYAIDFDGDGHIDLRNSTADAIGSVANFLTQHGWQRNDPGAIVYAAQVAPEQAWKPFIDLGLAATLNQDQLRAAGVRSEATPPDLLFGLVDLQNGAQPTQYFLGTNNFFAITHYNRSYFYAMSVIELGQAVRLARGPAPQL
jgi:membrane-bound lytic murein transglycosylase B